MPKITETLAVPQAGGEVVNVKVEITETAQDTPVVPENLEPAPVAVAPQEQPRKEEPKVSQKLSSPAAKPDPGPKPQNDQIKDWVAADQAFKQAQPQVISDGGKGVSN